MNERLTGATSGGEILGKESIAETNEREEREFNHAKQKRIDELFKQIDIKKKQVEHLERRDDRDEDLLDRHKEELADLEDELGDVHESVFEPLEDESTLLEGKSGAVIEGEISSKKISDETGK